MIRLKDVENLPTYHLIAYYFIFIIYHTVYDYTDYDFTLTLYILHFIKIQH